MPHWQQLGTLTHITTRLADSLPQNKLAELNAIRNEFCSRYPEPWTRDIDMAYKAIISDKYERWLDSGYGACELADERAIDIVADTLKFIDGIKYDLYDYIVMPNHIHMIIAPFEDVDLIMQSIKSISSRKINTALGRKGALWHREYFDHLIRSVSEYERTAYYIRHNADVLK
ncbi:MAG: transposase [Muribaculaceae bacterium]|nr:transposase [Muribaculaceae bacterium]